MWYENPWIIALITVIVVIVLRFAVALILAGGDVPRIKQARRAAMRILSNAEFAAKVEDLLKPPPPPKPSAAPIRMLTLLQREGRLVDFLLEDVAAYSNEQIGAAVRDIHRQCQGVLKEHLVMGPVLAHAEGDTVTVPAGFDPSAVQLTGNVTGQPPFRGVLRHHGWRVQEIKLAPPPEGQDEFVLQPAEVELP